MKTANVAEAVKSEHAVALLKQMYGENRVEENAARYQLVADGLFQFHTSPPHVLLSTGKNRDWWKPYGS